jgi:hypothetical protein
MKFNHLILLLALIYSCRLNAQCEDCFNEDDWKFAAGVALVNNIPYAPSLQIRQPLELNLRYKFLGKHVLRLGVPLAWKTKVYGSPVYPEYPLSEISSEKYVQNMQNEFEYNYFTRSLVYYYTIYGFSLGYSFDYSIYKDVSIFGGLDVAYYHQFIYSKYYRILYGELDDKYQNILSYCGINNFRSYNDCYSITPLIGLSYQFQKLRIEGNIGYNMTKYTNVTEVRGDGWYNPGIIKCTEWRAAYPMGFNRFIYNLSLFYTFN